MSTKNIQHRCTKHDQKSQSRPYDNHRDAVHDFHSAQYKMMQCMRPFHTNVVIKKNNPEGMEVSCVKVGCEITKNA